MYHWLSGLWRFQLQTGQSTAEQPCRIAASIVSNRPVSCFSRLADRLTVAHALR